MKKSLPVKRDIIFLDCTSDTANYLITINTVFSAGLSGASVNQKYGAVADSEISAKLIADQLCDDYYNNAFDPFNSPSFTTTILSIKTFN